MHLKLITWINTCLELECYIYLDIYIVLDYVLSSVPQDYGAKCVLYHCQKSHSQIEH